MNQERHRMKKKMIMLALAAVSAAMFALPAVASAGEWKIDPANGVFPLNYSIAGGETKLTAGQTITCSSVSGTGKYTTSTTGELGLTFHGCKVLGFFSCTSAGQPSGTIKTTALTTHNVILETSPSKVTGVLITPNAGHFASFTCAGGIASTAVTGNGIIGEVTSPACNTASTTSTLNFATSGGVQQWMQITTAGTKYDLSASINGGAAETAAQDGSGTVTFTQKATHTC
jgi:hypothetical protein